MCVSTKVLLKWFLASPGARIAEYSQLYDQVGFKDPSSAQADGQPGLPSSTSMPESFLEEDWLHSTYSNGELASFMSLPTEAGEARASSTPQRKLTPSCSVPALKTLPPAPTTPPTQRWSACVPAPGDKEEHVYSSIKRNPSFNAPSSSTNAKASPSRCKSDNTLGDRQPEVGDTGVRSGSAATGNATGTATAGPPRERHHTPSLGRAGRQSSLPERSSHGQPELTLQDSRQVVVLNRASAVLSATNNYLANFKDNDDDDDDYVEIRSEDEREPNGLDQSRGLCGALQSQSLPCTPARSCHPLSSLERKQLEKYLWSEPPQSQPNIVQSLRDKFHCLSSSSFA